MLTLAALAATLAAALMSAAPVVAAHGYVQPPREFAPRCRAGQSDTLTIAATTDTHGRIRAWNYYDNLADSARGLTRAASIVDSIRRAQSGKVVLVDAGDLLQGNPFAYVAARVTRRKQNPIVAAMNAMRYDAAVIGNHEFNYGVPYLNRSVAQARFPFIAANVYHTNGNSDGAAAYPSLTIVRRAGVNVGIVGATTPGSNVWDAENLKRAGLRVGDIVPAVRAGVTQARKRGADVVVVLLHSGLNEPSSYDTVSTSIGSENVAARVAAEVPGIDVIVYGHSHKENGGETIGHTLLIQPKNWATSIAAAAVPLACDASGERWDVGPATGTLVQTAQHREDKGVLRASEQVHRQTIAYVTSPIGSTPVLWRADSARAMDVPLTDFILEVERKAAGADLASTAAFDLGARLGPGPINIAQAAQLYPYDNTLRAVRISGAQLRSYLDYSSRYYKTNPRGALIVDTTVAGYNFDVVSGVEYTLDLSRQVGQRVTTLVYHGKPVTATDSFTLALNNYRQTGGGGYAMLRGARVVYDRQQEIRQLLVDEIRRRKVITPSEYFVKNWAFVRPEAAQ
ncbi:MAG: bifunctional metallophosphatase/5'-nucleotidase [Gemmatimonadaceae bacterium]